MSNNMHIRKIREDCVVYYLIILRSGGISFCKDQHVQEYAYGRYGQIVLLDISKKYSISVGKFFLQVSTCPAICIWTINESVSFCCAISSGDKDDANLSLL